MSQQLLKAGGPAPFVQSPHQRANEISFREVAREALRCSAAVLEHFLPGGEMRGREYLARNLTRSDATPGSFLINMDSGKWADFATDDRGGDLISLVVYLRGCKRREASELLIREFGLNIPDDRKVTASAPKVDGTLVMPIPDDASRPPPHPTLGEPSKIWTYLDDQKRELFHMCRFDQPGKPKQLRPQTLWRVDDRFDWRWESIPEPRPLYGLDLLASRPNDPVMVCEGEKAADAAQRLLPDFVVVTSPNGAKAARKADWKPLQSRVVTIWSDADSAGAKYAADVAELVKSAGAASIGILDLSRLLIGSEAALPEGFDAADFEKQSRDIASLREAIRLAAAASTSTHNGAATQGEDSGSISPENLRAAVVRLAKLPPLEYERVRKQEAADLQIDRIAVLDDEVERARVGGGDKLAGQPMTFPDVEPWHEPVNGSELLEEILVLCHRFLKLPDHGDTVVPLWIALTYLTEAFDCLPMLSIAAPEKGCGKSKVLELIQRLCHRPLSASNISAREFFGRMKGICR